MRAVHEAVCENLLIVAVRRACDPEVGDRRVGSQSGDQLRGPVGARDYCIVVNLMIIACVMKLEGSDTNVKTEQYTYAIQLTKC